LPVCTTGNYASNPETLRNLAAFRQSLQVLGWTEGRNVRFDHRWMGGGNADHYRTDATELVALGPDILLVPMSQ
jgi:hypothetical protein